MIRKHIQDDIDQLVVVQKTSIFKPSWIKFTFLQNKKKGLRLTLKEWLYLALQSGYTKHWAHEEYSRQEGYAWHHRRLIDIESEIKQSKLYDETGNLANLVDEFT